MRVVAGSARGRRLIAPEGRDTRPTLDRVREAISNSLISLDAVDGAVVLDLFAGSGALGIEALSRGSAHATFVDHDRSARRCIETNLHECDLADRAEVVSATVSTFLAEAIAAGRRFDLVLIDPPYATPDDEWSMLLGSVGVVAGGGVVVVESDRSIPVPSGWDARKEKKYGGTLVGVLLPPDVAEPS